MRIPSTPLSPNEQAALEQLEERFEVDDDPLVCLLDHTPQTCYEHVWRNRFLRFDIHLGA